MITKELKTAWLAELRSTENKQARSTLFEEHVDCTHNPHRQQQAVIAAKCMCALGCLVKAHAKNSTIETYQHKQIQRALHPDTKFEIITMNDDRYKSFEEIAEFVEKNVEAVTI